jgi:hypothetical protein
MYPFEPRLVSESWASRIVSRHNLWLEATRKEDDGDLLGAVTLYMGDAVACLESHSLARAALSCSCAAHCLEKVGHLGTSRILYAEAAKIYEQYSGECLDTSIQESIWSLQRAYENYVLSDNQQNASDVYYLYASLATKLSPIFGRTESSELLKLQELDYDRIPSRTIPAPVKPLKYSDEAARAIRRFLEARNSDARISELDELQPRNNEHDKG